MKRFALVATVLVLALTALPAVAEEIDAPEVMGLWMSQDGDYAIEVAPCDDALCGTVVWLESGEPTGDVILMKVAQQANDKGVFKGGEFHNPANGKTYYRLELRVDDEGKLKVEGQVGVMRRGRVVLSRFQDTTHWTRLQELPRG